MPAPPPVLHVTAEYHPYAHTGGLGGAVRGLAEHQRRGGRAVRVLMPLYQLVRLKGFDLEPVLDALEVPLGTRTFTARVWRHQAGPDHPEVLLLDIPSLFDRPAIYGERGDYPDNHLRFAALARAAVELVRRAAEAEPERPPTVLHPHDWHAALAPVYLRVTYAEAPWAARTPVVLNVHNAGYHGNFPPAVLTELGLPGWLYRWDLLEWYGRLDYLKGGLVFCDRAVTVSGRHAEELRTPEGGFGLHGLFAAMGARLAGIRNGIEPEDWDPSDPRYAVAPFSDRDLAGKRACKADLQARGGLRVDPALPLVAYSGRMVHQKGLELLIASALLRSPTAQFAFLGQGEARFIEPIAALARQWPDRVAIRTDFRDDREHRLLAGADLLLMPSLYEPCGLTQMRAQRYGTLPIVHWVGGLADTVLDDVSGFTFRAHATASLEDAFARALTRYADPPRWRAMMRYAMTRDFGWDGPAGAYDALYAEAAAERAAA